jgi:hypothetical protein
MSKPFCGKIPTSVISFSTMNDIAERAYSARSPTVKATTVT